MDKQTCTGIGKRLKNMRLKNGLTLEMVGQKIGFHKSTIMRWEKGDTSRIKLPIMEALAQLYNTTPEYLMGWNDEAVPSNAAFYPTQSLPVIKKMRAFSNEYSHDSYDGLAEIPSNMLDSGCRYFFVRMQDNSMSPKIIEGDMLLVSMQDTVENGEIALVKTGTDEGVVRRVIFANDSVLLVCENSGFAAESLGGNEGEKIKILGKVVKLIRDVNP